MLPLIITLGFSKRPIVMVPPMYASNMWITVGNVSLNENKTISVKDKLLWVNKSFFEPPFDVFGLKSMKITWKENNTIETAAGYFCTKDFGGDESTKHIESIENFKSNFAISLNESIHFFKERGYQIHNDLFVAPYDWRIAPAYTNEFWPRLKHLVENAFRNNKRQRVVLFGYDLGGFMIQQFLGEKVTKEWKEKYIEKAILLAPTFAGRGPNFQEMWERFSPLAPWMENSELSDIVETWPSVHAQNPNFVVFKDTPIAITKDNVRVSPFHTHSLLQASGRTKYSTSSIYNKSHEILRRAPAPPGVETEILYNSAIPTTQTLNFSAGFGQRPEVIRGRGDGEVLAMAMEWACGHWATTKCVDFKRPRANYMHRRLIANEEVLDAVYLSSQTPSEARDIRDSVPEVTEIDERTAKDDFDLWKYFSLPKQLEKHLNLTAPNSTDAKGDQESEDVVYDNDDGTTLYPGSDLVIEDNSSAPRKDIGASSEEAEEIEKDNEDDENEVDAEDDYEDAEEDLEDELDDDLEDDLDEREEEDSAENELVKEIGQVKEEKQTPPSPPPKNDGKKKGFDFFGWGNRWNKGAAGDQGQKQESAEKDEEKETDEDDEAEDEGDIDFGKFFAGQNKNNKDKAKAKEQEPKRSKKEKNVKHGKIPKVRNATEEKNETAPAEKNFTGPEWTTSGAKLGIGEPGVVRKRVRVGSARIHRRKAEPVNATEEDDENAIDEEELLPSKVQREEDEVVVKDEYEDEDEYKDKDEDKDKDKDKDEDKDEDEVKTRKDKDDEERRMKKDEEVSEDYNEYESDDSDDAEDNKIRNAKRKEDEKAGDRPLPGQVLDLEDDEDEEDEEDESPQGEKEVEGDEKEKEGEVDEKEHNYEEEYTSEYEYEYVYESDGTAAVFDDSVYWSEANPPGPIPDVEEEAEEEREESGREYAVNLDDDEEVDEFDDFDSDFGQDQDL